MHGKSSRILLALAICALAGTATACWAKQGEVDALKQEVADLRTSVDSLRERADSMKAWADRTYAFGTRVYRWLCPSGNCEQLKPPPDGVKP